MHSTIEIELSQEDRTLLLKELKLRPELQKQIRFGWGKEPSRYIALTFEEWCEIDAAVSITWEEAREGKRKRALGELHRHLLESLADAGNPEGSHSAAPLGEMAEVEEQRPHPALLKVMDRLLADNPPKSISELERLTAQAQREFARMPLDELDGLTMMQISALLVEPLDEPNCVVFYGDDLTPAEAAAVPFVRNMNALLRVLPSMKQVAFNDEGELPRPVVKKLAAVLDAPMFTGHPKGKTPFPALQAAVAMYLQIGIHAGYIDMDDSGDMLVTPIGLASQAPEEAANQYFHLLDSLWEEYFQPSDEDDFDSEYSFEDDDESTAMDDEFMEDESTMWRLLPFTLFRMSQQKGWYLVPKLIDLLLVPALRTSGEEEVNELVLEIFTAVLMPLLHFGLLETDSGDMAGDPITIKIRTTALFDKVIKVDWNRMSEEAVYRTASTGDLPFPN